MQVTEKISYKISKEIAVKCKALEIDEQISLLNISIFEDPTINHTDRLKYQYELLNFAKKKIYGYMLMVQLVEFLDFRQAPQNF